MEYFWWLYLATRLDAISNATLIVTIVASVAAVILTIIWLVSHDQDMWSYQIRNSSDSERLAIQDGFRKKVTHPRNVLVALALATLVLHVLTPSKKDAMFIAGGIGVIEASKAVAGSGIAKKSVQIVEEWLTKELDSIKEDSKEAAKKGANKAKEAVKDTIEKAVK